MNAFAWVVSQNIEMLDSRQEGEAHQMLSVPAESIGIIVLLNSCGVFGCSLMNTVLIKMMNAESSLIKERMRRLSESQRAQWKWSRIHMRFKASVESFSPVTDALSLSHSPSAFLSPARGIHMDRHTDKSRHSLKSIAKIRCHCSNARAMPTPKNIQSAFSWMLTIYALADSLTNKLFKCLCVDFQNQRLQHRETHTEPADAIEKRV